MKRRRDVTQTVRRVAACAFILSLAGCALQARTSNVPASHDFGPAPRAQRTPSVSGTFLVPSVKAPPWLDERVIAYRLDYEDPTRIQAYSMSRWAADPTDLIAERVRSRLGGSATGVVTPAFSARSDYTLRIELADFSQHFGAPAQSSAVLAAHASLLHNPTRTLIAQRTFSVTRPAEPNARGAIEALTQTTDAFVEELVAWTAQQARSHQP